MAGNDYRAKPRNDRASALVRQLMVAKGWTPDEVALKSGPAGDPNEAVSRRTVYRVLNESHVPSLSKQFELAQTFDSRLTPLHLWGHAPLPEFLRDMGVYA